MSNLDLQTMSAKPGLTETIALFSTKIDMLMTSLSFKLCMAYLLTELSDDIHDHMSQFFRTSLRLVKLDSPVVLANKDFPGAPLGTSRKEKRWHNVVWKSI